MTDAELRATPVPVSGTVTTGGLTDAQLRASAVPVTGTITAVTAPALLVLGQKVAKRVQQMRTAKTDATAESSN